MSRQSRERVARHAARLAGLPVPPRPLRAVPLNMARQCGVCTACCVVLQIGELDKLRGEPCPHLKPEADTRGMCSIWNAPLFDSNEEYVTPAGLKPRTCAEFRCLWLKGELPENLYPAACNVMFRYTGDGLKLSAFELVKDAARAPIVADFIATVADRGVPVVIVPPAPAPGEDESPRRLIPPPPGKNPKFDAELRLLQHKNPGQFAVRSTPPRLR